MAALQALEHVATSQSDAYKALAEALKDYFDSFKSTETPTRWVATDFSEWEKEQEELMAKAGMPVTEGEREKLRWLQHELDA